MNTVKALLLFLTFTWQEKAAAAIPTKSTASTTRTTTSPASPYNVVCTSTEEAKLTLTDNSYKADFPPGCHATGPLYTLNTSCLGGTIFIYKQPISATKVIGGDGTIALTITCVVPVDGVTATPVIQVKMAASVSPTVESHPFTAVTMTLSTTDPSTNPTVASQATLGEHLYLVISSRSKGIRGRQLFDTRELFRYRWGR
ncbi:uncharacterized protein LOC124285223 [Haliotis rubra]|uniref:uncharacterized protein LOC124285223 n=1 Tax=Haliotis rubra TaxID=36100 RepID=UPI001EE515D6|nr:uncharacterized protein LOC124285223 [Haliotis rubra]XP_046577379.1 uncharacterized protein LOC124285223 [Haliotis rubra]